MFQTTKQSSMTPVLSIANQPGGGGAPSDNAEVPITNRLARRAEDLTKKHMDLHLGITMMTYS